MAKLTLDTLLQTFGDDFRAITNGPLQYDKSIVLDFRFKANEYGLAKFRAMWNDYLGVRFRKGWMVSLENFLEPEQLNTYSMRHEQRMGTAKGKLETEQFIFHAHYTCEHAHMYDNGICTIATESGHGWDVMDKLPDVWSEPCPQCGGKWYRDDVHPDMVGRLKRYIRRPAPVVEDIDVDRF